ncbi:MAG: glutamine--fructose-6-phosphate transaminase (isomerizing) [Clostridiales bacterium]|nr:glutamine--fructose-6-phosphate transaminase (isomerizing) [Clostridiales bacterium]
MCGIVGFVGRMEAAPILLEGLKRLEYRGYDSAGIAIEQDGKIEIVKTKGRICCLDDMTDGGKKTPGTLGVGHTRWATHGEPSDVNSHPHRSMSGKIAVVHNGIIENYMELREYLRKKGFVFVSDTDTEVVAHLVDYYYKGDLLEAMVKAVNRLEGSYALGVVCADYPDRFAAVRKASPLIVGLSEEGNFIASDVTALISYTKRVVYLEDDEIVLVGREGIQAFNMNKEEIDKPVSEVTWNIDAAEKGGYEHFMLKEIMEQPAAIRETIRPRLKEGQVVLDDIQLTAADLQNFNRIVITACGSAYHAGVVGKYVLEELTRIPVEVDLASEFRYRQPIIDEHTLVVIISQSGETADTLAALKEAKRLGARTLSIVNVVGSAIAKESDDVLYTWAGPEIAVATTKAYSTQLTVLYLFALYAAGLLGTRPAAEISRLVQALEALPDQIEALLPACKPEMQRLAAIFYGCENLFFIGRNLDYAAALEGSLKLKEISYIHSEAYAAGELKHGTISLIDEGRLVIALCCQDRLFDKMRSNIREVKARGAVVMALATAQNKAIAESADQAVLVPETDPLFMASLEVVPLQLFAYYVASANGCDIDKPRNLAKSVTVE